MAANVTIIRHVCKGGPLRHTDVDVENIMLLNRRKKFSRLNDKTIHALINKSCIHRRVRIISRYMYGRHIRVQGPIRHGSSSASHYDFYATNCHHF